MKFNLPWDGSTVICERQGNETCFNFPHKIVKHSPTGMEWGYEGSGPADFAINAIFAFTNRESFSTRPEVYQEFKRRFVAKLPDEGGEIGIEVFRDWLAGAHLIWFCLKCGHLSQNEGDAENGRCERCELTE